MKLNVRRGLILICLLAAVLLIFSSRAQPVITMQPTNQTVVAGGTAMFSVTATDIGPLTYQWQLNGTNLPNNIISTVAGGNLFNNLPATNTIFNSAAGSAVDGFGNLFIADSGNNVVRKVSPNGATTIVAGNGSGSFSGDGGAATNAGLYFPNAVIVDKAGNLLIADTYNYRIRKVDTNGIITTVAGNGFSYVTFNPYSVGDGGAATNGTLWNPTGLTLDTNGNLFICDYQNNRIAKVGTNGIITTVAGIPGEIGGYGPDGFPATVSRLSNPSGVAVDSANNLYIADTYNYRIRKVDSSGTISTIVGTGNSGYSGDGGAPTSAKINNPAGVTVDAAHNLYIVDAGNHCIRKVGTNNIIKTIAGNGTSGFSGDGGYATNSSLAGPQNVAVDGVGDLFISDTGNNRIREIGTNGIITTVAGSILNDGDYATNATINSANGIAFDSAGNLYIADSYNNRIRKIDTNGIITTVAGNGIPAFAGDGNSATNASLYHPNDIALDTWGNLLIADSYNQRVRKVDTNGIISTVAGTGLRGFSGDGGAATNARLSTFYGVAVDGIGNLFIADSLNNRIRHIDTNGIITTVAGSSSSGFSGDGGVATNAAINEPWDVTMDSAGNLFIADFFNRRIRKVDTNGIISTVAGNGTFTYSGDGGVATNASLSIPRALTVDSVGEFFIADSNYQRIRKVNTNGIISTVAGNGVQGFSGDGGSGNNASMSFPRGVAMDGTGNLFITDGANCRIRKLTYVDYADQATFTVTNVTTGSLNNNYSVIVTGADGSVTSSIVTLNVILPPQNFTASLGNAGLQLQFTGTTNYPYILQSATNLTPPVFWQPLLTNAADGNGNWSFAVTNTQNAPACFYRVSVQ
jgi:sugar lactone lactonase YvrE